MLLGCKLRHEFGFVRLFSHEETGPVQRPVRDKAVAPRCRHLNGDWTQWSQNRVLRPLRSLSAWALAWSWRASSSISSPASSASSCRGSWARPRSTPCAGPLKLPALGPKTGSCGTKKLRLAGTAGAGGAALAEARDLPARVASIRTPCDLTRQRVVFDVQRVGVVEALRRVCQPRPRLPHRAGRRPQPVSNRRRVATTGIAQCWRLKSLRK